VSNTAPTTDERQLQYIHINDFSPGCYDASLIAGSNPVPSPQSAPGPFPAPLGAADANVTHGCMNLPTGGLGPLPQMIQSHSIGDFGINIGPAPQYIIAMFSTNMNAQNASDELVLVQTHYSSPTQIYNINSILWESPGGNQLVLSNATNYTAFHPVTCCYPYMTRVTENDPTTTVGDPVLVLPITGWLNPANTSAMLTYPIPGSIAYSAADIATSGDIVGYGFGHQGRICSLVPTAGRWPGSPPLQGAPDALSYTEPANSTTWGSPPQDEVFGPENPYGYGAVTSVSAGELFLVKTHGGAIVVQGDLNNPTVTTLSAVKSTGPIFGKSDSDPNGSYYCVQNEGAWAWNGGNASTKVSAQLDDNFFTCPNLPPLTTMGLQAYGYYVQRWGDWMLFSNNWLYNSGGGGGWWRLYDPAAASFFYYTPGQNTNIMYAGVPLVSSDNTPVMFEFDSTNGTNLWLWQSLPIRPQANDRTIEVREVTIRAANPTLDAGANVAVNMVDSDGNLLGNSPAWAMSSTTRGVQIRTFNFGVQTEDITINLGAGGQQTAPIIYDITVGYRIRQGTARQ
jgi:hypothetical protein